MNIFSSVAQGSVQVNILRPEGRLDGQTYKALIEKASELYELGARNILLDLSEITYMSSAGVVALHTIARMLQGEPIPDLENGWGAVKAKGKALQTGIHKNFKLLKPRTEITSVLEMVGFTEFLQIFHDQDIAVQSF